MIDYLPLSSSLLKTFSFGSVRSFPSVFSNCRFSTVPAVVVVGLHMWKMPILLFLGDFKQFEPVRDIPLWKDNGPTATKDEKRAREIWSQVKDVIFLTEQMRQRD